MNDLLLTWKIIAATLWNARDATKSYGFTAVADALDVLGATLTAIGIVVGLVLIVLGMEAMG